MSQLCLIIGMVLLGTTGPGGAETTSLIFALALAGMAPSLLRRPD
jgi:hypothetical protein